MEDLPSQWEQDVAEAYVYEHLLNRPNTTISKAIISSILFLVVGIAVSAVLYMVFLEFGIFSFFLDNEKKINDKLFIRFVLFTVIVLAIMTLAFSRVILIGCIHLYQHYACEDLRRSCVFKPTCSEYAILALRKYGVLIGSIKTFDRLWNRCRGSIFRIDYP